MGVDQLTADSQLRQRFSDDENLYFGDDDDYRVRYDATAGEWVYESADIDGGGTTGPVMKFSDGDDTAFFPGAAGFPSPGNSPVYRAYYDSTAGQWVVESTDIDGAGTTGNVMVIPDGDNTVYYPGPIETGEFGSVGFRDGGAAAINVIYQSGSPRIARVRNYADVPTLWEVRSQAGDPTADDREATVALTRTSDTGNVEGLDIYNNGYHSSADTIAVAHGMRVLKAGTGVWRDIYTDYYDQDAATRTPIRHVRSPDQANGPYIVYRQPTKIGNDSAPVNNSDFEIETASPIMTFLQSGPESLGFGHEHYNLGDTNVANLWQTTGLVVVTNVGTQNVNATALLSFETSNTEASLIADPQGLYSTTAGNAGTINIYWDTNNSAWEVENQTGSTQDIYFMYLTPGLSNLG